MQNMTSDIYAVPEDYVFFSWYARCMCTLKFICSGIALPSFLPSPINFNKKDQSLPGKVRNSFTITSNHDSCPALPTLCLALRLSLCFCNCVLSKFKSRLALLTHWHGHIQILGWNYDTYIIVYESGSVGRDKKAHINQLIQPKLRI